jgi:hypothetical protein
MPRRPAPLPDLTADQVARALGHPDAAAFLALAGDYERRGLRADPITGRYDPEAFERWRRLRSPALFPELTAPPAPRDAGALIAARLERMRHG